jgi:transitional endoplasmic reticulum ATPase
MDSNKDRKETLALLETLAGERFNEDDITYEGTKLVIPERMTARDAISTLESHMAQMETHTTWTRKLKARPWDGAAAFERAVKRVTGTVGVQKGAFFGMVPPARETINISSTETMDVPWGTIAIDLFEGEAFLGSYKDEDFGLMFVINVTAPRKYRAGVEGFFRVLQEEIDERSIYRGQSFDGKSNPNFLDLSGVNEDEVVYSADVLDQLNANVWSLLDYTDVQRELGLPLKRSILMHGPYGTGKTLAAMLTAQRAKVNGWTFIYCRPGKDDIHEVMQTARLYQPSVVFFEDVDSISDVQDEARDSVSVLLDTFDGVTAKGTEIIAILTTNHVDRIHKGMVRPGRLDAIIEIGALDNAGIETLINVLVDKGMRTTDGVNHLDYEAIAFEMEGFMPAFVKEAIDRASRYAVARTGGIPTSLSTEDFVQAARGLVGHLGIMEEAEDKAAVDTLGRSFKAIALGAAEEVAMTTSYENDRLGEIAPFSTK